MAVLVDGDLTSELFYLEISCKQDLHSNALRKGLIVLLDDLSIINDKDDENLLWFFTQPFKKLIW